MTPAFAAKIDRSAGADACWPWLGYRDRYGYGHTSTTTRRGGLAHRLVYEELVGAIPNGLVLDHLCRNPSCVNPAHLEPVTFAENRRRVVYQPRSIRCRVGHDRSPRERDRHYCNACRRAAYHERTKGEAVA